MNVGQIGSLSAGLAPAFPGSVWAVIHFYTTDRTDLTSHIFDLRRPLLLIQHLEMVSNSVTQYFIACQCYVDGPYGTPTRQIFASEHAVLIGAGIGITPFASILQSIMYR